MTIPQSPASRKAFGIVRAKKGAFPNWHLWECLTWSICRTEQAGQSTKSPGRIVFMLQHSEPLDLSCMIHYSRPFKKVCDRINPKHNGVFSLSRPMPSIIDSLHTISAFCEAISRVAYGSEDSSENLFSCCFRDLFTLEKYDVLSWTWAQL